jgi:hypothetical protein
MEIVTTVKSCCHGIYICKKKKKKKRNMYFSQESLAKLIWFVLNLFMVIERLPACRLYFGPFVA